MDCFSIYIFSFKKLIATFGAPVTVSESQLVDWPFYLSKFLVLPRMKDMFKVYVKTVELCQVLF